MQAPAKGLASTAARAATQAPPPRPAAVATAAAAAPTALAVAAPPALAPAPAASLSLERYLEFWQLLSKGTGRVQPLTELERSLVKAADLKQASARDWWLFLAAPT